MTITFDASKLLDEVGCAILLALQQNARIPFSELGRQVGLSAPAVAERVRRLEDTGIIQAYRAQVDPAALGFGLQAYIRLSIRYGRCEMFTADIGKMPSILSAERVTGEDCYVLRVAVRDVAHLEATINSLNSYGEPVTSLILSAAGGYRPLMPLPSL
ncbi:Lrp/AsnC family transcriptional regulator [Deinococcus oregonensis]|uniref:Lrp/AsnC family transcriptional regulator n=1 Tax=Deinococcus oregonensis TaxID=1805970 RepID=A0ABV6AWR3_9DEIO